MIGFEAVCRMVEGIEPQELERWIHERWVLPESQPEGYVFHEIDVARVRLIVELRRDLAVGEEAMPVLLNLLDQLYALRRRMKALAQSSAKVVCISEVGLDFAQGMPPIATQEQVLRREVRLARELGLPVIFHSREFPGRLEDHKAILRLLKEERVGEMGGAWHYFQWDADLAQACLDMGLYVSIAKPFLRLQELQGVVRDLPLERLVLETDAYPQTFKRNRARWNEPKDVREIAEAVARVKGVSSETVAAATTGNLLGILKGRVTQE